MVDTLAHVDLSLIRVLRNHPSRAVTVASVTLATFALYRAIKRAIGLRGLRGPPSPSFLRGHGEILVRPDTGIKIQEELLEEYGGACRLKGALGEDQLWLCDTRAIREIMAHDYEYFEQPEIFKTWIELVTGPNLFTQSGHKRRVHRKVLNPVFSAMHTRDLTPTMTTIAHHTEDILLSKIQSSKTGIIDMYELTRLVALETIGQAGLGHSFGVLEGKDPEYLKAPARMFPAMIKLWYLDAAMPYLTRIGTRRFRRFVVDHTPSAAVQELKNVSNVLHTTAEEIYLHKKTALANGTLEGLTAVGKDIMTVLLKQNAEADPNERMTEEEVISQITLLMFAGHSSTGASMCRTLELLAHNPEIQTRLRNEVRAAHKEHGKALDFEQLHALPYLDAVIRESLRHSSPDPTIERTATKDVVLPLLHPLKASDGHSTITHLRVPKGTYITVSTHAANRDKQLWGEDADEFRPERWLKPLPQSVADSKPPGVYSSMMTFYGGIGSCPGYRFLLLEIKLIVSNLISTFIFEPSGDEVDWHFRLSNRPYVKGKDGRFGEKPQLPLKVTVWN